MIHYFLFVFAKLRTRVKANLVMDRYQNLLVLTSVSEPVQSVLGTGYTKLYTTFVLVLVLILTLYWEPTFVPKTDLVQDYYDKMMVNNNLSYQVILAPD